MISGASEKELIVANGRVELLLELQSQVDKLKEKNKKLQKQLEEYEQSLKISKEILDLQGQDGNYNYDNYMLGLYNGMEYIISLFEKREPIYKDGKNIVFLEDKNKNQQKEFIEYLEKEIVDSSAGSGQQYYAQQHLRLYKEIIGGDK